MFSNALESIRKFTMPVTFVRRFRNGRIASGLATLIIVNRDGWVLTAAHVVEDIAKFDSSLVEMQDYEHQKQLILDDPNLKERDKRRRIERLPVSDDWITHQAAMWGHPQWRVTRGFFVDAFADLALGQLSGFDPARVPEYPIFENPAGAFPIGTSLCRLGFPFHQIKATFSEATQKFSLDPGTFPIPYFPNDGIHTRLVLKNAGDGSRQAKFIETSSPGLRGQSGGPIFDHDGHIWAIQTSTTSLPLGFSPTVRQGSREIVEHQFMHLGWGAHVEEAVRLMRGNNVQFEMASL